MTVVVLLLAGIGLLLAGLVAIGFGIQINEFSFGNTLIVAGTVAACTGMLLIGLWMAVRELQNIARRLGPANAEAESHAETPSQAAPAGAAPRDQAAENSGFFSREASGSEMPAMWNRRRRRRRPHRPGMGRPRPASARRTIARWRPPPPSPRRRPSRSAICCSLRHRARSASAPRREQIRRWRVPHPEPAAPPPVPESPETPPASFDDAWPKPERARADVPPPRRAGRTPSTFAEPDPAAPARIVIRRQSEPRTRRRSRFSNQASSTAWPIRCIPMARSRRKCPRA